MGRIGRLLSILKATRGDGSKVTDVKVDQGGGENITAEQFSTPGDDSQPRAEDYVYLGAVRQNGRASALGYVDPGNAQKAAEGEKRIYARDENGAEICEVWLKADGTVRVENTGGAIFDVLPSGAIKGSNGSGVFELQSGGDFVVNGATIATDGSITSPTAIDAPSVVANGKELAEHTHAINSGSSAPGPTGVNN